MMRVKKTYGLTGKWRDLDHVFTYLVSGSADFIIGGVSHTLTAGDVILFPPLLTHMIIQRDQQLLTQYIFHFDFYEDKRRTAIPNHDILGSKDENIVPQKELLMKNEAVISHFCEECRMILAMTLRSAEPEKMDQLKNKKAWALVEKTVNFLNSVPVDEELSNDEIAFHIGVSPNYLTKSFSACLGVSLHQYIIMMRMEKAQKLLLNGKENITEVAQKLGYSNIFVFSKAFKRYSGVSPSYFIEHTVNIEQENMSMFNHDNKEVN